MRSGSRRAPSVALGLVVFLVILPGLPGASGSHPAAAPVRTASVAAAPTYTETLQAPNLPGTVTFSFTFDGMLHSAVGGGTVLIHGVTPGAHTIANISASPAPVGWQYFGWSEPGTPIFVPAELSANFSFSLLNLSAPLSTIHFHAFHVVLGTVWAMEINGTTTTSSTLWINVSSRPGTVPVQALSTVDGRGTTRYEAPAAEPAKTLSANATYLETYTVRFEVQVLASSGGFVLPNGSSWYTPGENLTIRATGYSQFAFASWNGTGTGSYSGIEPRHTMSVGGPLIETATFVPTGPNRLVIRIDQVGVPTGTMWTAYIDGGGFSSDTNAIAVPNVLPCGTGPGGLYNLSIPAAYSNATDPLLAERFVVGPYPASVCGGTILNVTFHPEAMVSYRSSPGGAVSAANASGQVPTGAWVPNGSSVTFTATPAPGYNFSGWASNGSSAPSVGPILLGVSVLGPVEEVAVFAPVSPTAIPTYSATLTTTIPLPPEATWAVQINGTSYASSTQDLTITGLPAGSYQVAPASVMAPDGGTELRPSVASFPLVLPATAPILVEFTTWFRVVVWEAHGGSASTNASWAQAGTSIILTATAAAGNVFLGWTGTGVGNYTGSSATVTVAVSGPLQESAAFVPAPPASRNWLGLGLAVGGGVLLGVVAALVLPRRRLPAPGAPTTPDSEGHDPA